MAEPRALSAFFDSLTPPPAPAAAAGAKREKRSKGLRRERRAATRHSESGGGTGDGAVVGAGAAAIPEANVGHRLLRGMGWTGGGLGREGEGIAEPIEAFMRRSRAGLGI